MANITQIIPDIKEKLYVRLNFSNTIDEEAYQKSKRYKR